MKKSRQKAVFIFRRDLRLEDNLGLLKALAESETVVPIFTFDPRQSNPEENKYFSPVAFNFLLNSLAELDNDLKNRDSQLHIFSGQPEKIVTDLIEQDDIDAVYVNKDYTPFARKRDKEIADVCEANKVDFNRTEDAVLSPIEEIRTGEDKLYTVFTPFMKKAMMHEIKEPQKNNYDNYFSAALQTKTIKLSEMKLDLGKTEPILHGGRDEALGILSNFVDFKNYKNTRNLPATKGTSRLSAHHKFGTISIRETYKTALRELGEHSQYVAELYWRDFYYYIAYHFPIVFKKSFLPWAKEIKWVNDKKQFTAWCEGKTGVPMVDAGMRELNKTGWIHNRSRMIVASYLTKNLLIDWRWGEQYFATKLIDYDPAQNNGGWQWSASTGADPRPLRIFNPYTQAQKYDHDAKYIKKWVPELAAVENDKLTDSKTQDFSNLAPDYPTPIIDQKDSYHRAMETYKKAKADYRKDK